MYTFLRVPRVLLKSGTGSAIFGGSDFFSGVGLGLDVSTGSLISGLGGSEGLALGFADSLGGGDLTFAADSVFGGGDFTFSGSLGGGDLTFSAADFFATVSVFFVNMSSTLFVGVVGVFYIEISNKQCTIHIT